VIVNANFDDYYPLRLCSQLRSLERTLFLPILIITEQGCLRIGEGKDVGDGLQRIDDALLRIGAAVDEQDLSGLVGAA
ncbi:hypothetical protein ACC685_39210, partial [Rhizobium ruizarguesonis]